MKVLFAILAALSVTACNVKLKGKSDSPKNPPVDKGIAGPNIQGLWLSGCDSNFRDGGYRTLDVTYGKESVSRKAHLYHADSPAKNRGMRAQSLTLCRA